MTDKKSKYKAWLYPIAALVSVFVVAGGVIAVLQKRQTQSTQVAATNTASAAQTGNGVVDPGTSLDGRPAPSFTLTDQFGKQISLSDYRGKVVVLAFVDSECTTICPLTTESMMRAMQMLGPAAAKHVQLLGIDANPDAISVADVKKYSEEHNMAHSWHFLTGSLTQLKSMWKNYYIYDQIVNGQIDHTPALYIIGPNGKEQYLFMTPGQYAAVDAQANVVASQVAKFLPASVRPKVKPLSYHAPSFGPGQDVSVPLATGNGDVSIGPGKPQLLAYFASWAPGVEKSLKSLDTYAAQPGSPQVVGIDVLTTEPGNHPDQELLKAVSPHHYKIAVDKTGDLTDAYQATDLMWLTLTDGHGHIIWSHDGWLPGAELSAEVKSALAKAQTS